MSDASGPDSASTSPKPKPRAKSPYRKKLPKKAQNMTREQLKLAMLKKREYDNKALEIVEKLIEPVEDADALLTSLRDINQCHFEDIVEERAILKICGYPLCKEAIEHVPKKQYSISMKTNKVYDITERKKFCSVTCFQSATYVKEQMLTSPLWLRDKEEIPEFKLLSLDD